VGSEFDSSKLAGWLPASGIVGNKHTIWWF